MSVKPKLRVAGTDRLEALADRYATLLMSDHQPDPTITREQFADLVALVADNRRMIRSTQTGIRECRADIKAILTILQADTPAK
ncbi:hypothetical protein [Paludisphaera borealis]|uniref:Uncharacterized protein n=1 Tax=Paludisphaera borealis TaxID=1387353 RepID=A0A1U7CX88_9BACT|nr:hypothetical protein [Paludisphaera borealis]APW63508.1 hypothetical protein BSF38_05080 [Paludisphaera borealis]